MEKLTIREATEDWVGGFNSIPNDMLRTLRKADPLGWEEVTKPTGGSHVCVHGIGYGTVVSHTEDIYKVRLENDETRTVKENNLELILDDDVAPMWGTIWSFKNDLDKKWLTKETNLYKMSDCGFRIFRHKDWGFFFGIDGAGYDFYKEHWVPLYKARGLQWHSYKEE